MKAALLGVMEVRFTIISMTISVIAVFIPILMMGGIVGRLFREFAVTVSAAIVVSALVSLTVTPMLCGWMIRLPNRRTLAGRASSRRGSKRALPQRDHDDRLRPGGRA